MVSEGSTHSVLRRKAVAAASGAAIRPQSAEPPAVRALRKALPRASQNEMKLALDVHHVDERAEASLVEVLELPAPCAMLAILEGTGDELGLLAIAPEVLEGVIQQQTTGSVLADDGLPRRPTRTDAAMSAALIDRIMGEFEAALAATPDLSWAGGYRYASFLDEPRTLGLLLEDVGYRAFRIEVELAGGVRRGDILLALPGGGRGRPRAAAPGAATTDGAGAVAPGPGWQDALEEAVLASPAALEAVLTRQMVPLGGVMRWQAGALVALPTARLDGISLEGPGTRGLATARLGQLRGFRAVRLTEPGPVEGNAYESDIASPAGPAPGAEIRPRPEPAPMTATAPLPAAEPVDAPDSEPIADPTRALSMPDPLPLAVHD
jgi:flagellar motor switch protein FliM